MDFRKNIPIFVLLKKKVRKKKYESEVEREVRLFKYYDYRNTMRPRIQFQMEVRQEENIPNWKYNR